MLLFLFCLNFHITDYIYHLSLQTQGILSAFFHFSLFLFIYLHPFHILHFISSYSHIFIYNIHLHTFISLQSFSIHQSIFISYLINKSSLDHTISSIHIHIHIYIEHNKHIHFFIVFNVWMM